MRNVRELECFDHIVQLLPSIPRYPNVLMSQWMQSTFPADVFRVLAHLEDRVKTVMDLVNESDLITKTSYVLGSALLQ